jgi:hypothetical protein
MIPSDKFTLKVIKGSPNNRAFVFETIKLNIGSGYTQNDLIMNVDGISVQHAKIWYEKHTYFIQNLSDKQLIVGHGNPLTKKDTCELATGSKIDFGAVVLQFIHGTRTLSALFLRSTRISPKTSDGEGHRFIRLIKNKRSIGIGCIALGIFLMLIMAINGVNSDSENNIKPYPVASSEEPIELPAKGKYGYIKNNDKSHPDKAIFTFKADRSNFELHYTAGGIDSYKEVSISLNGQLIGYAPLSKGAWGKETVMRLPKDLLTKGGVNHLVFNSLENPPNFNQWAVKNIWVKVLSSNLCDVNKANKLIELAEELYEQKSISKGNLYLAYQYYCDAVSNLQDCGKDTELLQEARLKKVSSMQELDTLFKGLKFAFMKAFKMNDYSKCRSILQDMVLHIPDTSDERHIEAAKKLEEYNRYFEMRNK